MTAKAPWVFGKADSRHHGVSLVSKEPEPWKVAYKKAGLDWKVQLRSPQSADLDAIAAPEWKQVVKVFEDPTTKEKAYLTLAMVGLRYTLCQNENAFSWFDQVTFEGSAIVKAAGHRDFGKIVWMVAERPFSFELYPGATVKEQLILETSHNGSTALTISFQPHIMETGVPVAFATGQKGVVTQVKIRHTKSMDVKLKTVHHIFDKENLFFQNWRNAILGEQGKGGLKHRVVTTAELKSVVERLFPAHSKKIEKDGKTEEVTEVSGKAEKARKLLLERIDEQFETVKNAHEAAGQTPPSEPTALDAFVGISNYAALDKRTRNQGESWVNATSGTGADLRQKAFDLLCGL
jgi:hypothetical protein